MAVNAHVGVAVIDAVAMIAAAVANFIFAIGVY